MARRPNIIEIMSDDQGAWALGCAGNSELRTPSLDRLASGGIRFENYFCASPVCSPARASFLTGCIPSRHGIHDWIRCGNLDDPEGRVGGAGQTDRAVEYLAGIPGYTDHLARAGYLCALSGKWHLGDSARPQKGFTWWFTHALGGGPYYGAPMIRDGAAHAEPRYVTDAITEGALEFLSSPAARRGADRPFHLGVHYTAPHSPWNRDNHPVDLYDSYRSSCPFQSVPEEAPHPWQVSSAPHGVGEARRDLLAGYFAAVTAMDAGIGRILAAVHSLGLAADTLVVFSSDNGMNMGHHGIWGKGNGTFPLNMFDTSVKVPLIVSMPGTVPAGRTESRMVSQYDVFPTILDFLGIPAPDCGRLPGRSFAPLLRGRPMEGRDAVVVFDEYGPVRMVRTRDRKYVHRHPYGPHELYDLAADPGERTNLLAAAAAAPERAGEAVELKRLLDGWFLRYADPGRDGAREGVTGFGQLGRAGAEGGGKPAWFVPDGMALEPASPRPAAPDAGRRPPGGDRP